MNLAQIIEGCKINDSLLQEILFKKYYSKMKGISIRYCGDNKDSDKMVENAFVNALKLIKRYSGTTETHFINWFKKLMIEEHIQIGKKSELFKETEDDFKKIEIPDDIQFTDEIDINNLLEGLNSLTYGERFLLNMCLYDGFAITVAAKKLGISHQCAHARYDKALIKTKINTILSKQVESIEI